jgi:hypothetical protein
VTSFIIESTLSLYITTTGGSVHTHHKEPQVHLTSLSASNNTSIAPSTAKLLRLDVGVTTGLYEPPKRILVVCSSHSRGLYLSEFAEPYNILRKKFNGKEGIQFIIASPKGGSVSFILSYLNTYLYQFL